MAYSILVRVDAISIYLINNKCAKATAQQFIERHEDKHVLRKNILELVLEMHQVKLV